LARHFLKKVEYVASVNAHLTMISFVNILNAYAVVPMSSIPKAELAELTIIKNDSKKYQLYLIIRDNYLLSSMNKVFIKEIVSKLRTITT